jgi:hypothetical protein
MAQHTPGHEDSDSPGPWTVEATETRVVVMAADGGFVAECTDGHDSDEGYVMADKALHIASLIAAAPDLLAALEYALPYLRAAVPNPRNGVNHDCTPDVNCVDRALAAIAKATGSAS